MFSLPQESWAIAAAVVIASAALYLLLTKKSRTISVFKRLNSALPF
jgi:hypothetical protein